jgi:hypothetical protein
MKAVGIFAMIHGLPSVHFASNIIRFYNSNSHGRVYSKVWCPQEIAKVTPAAAFTIAEPIDYA